MRENRKHSEVFIKNQETPQTVMCAGVVRKVLAYSEALMVCEVTIEKGAVVASHRHPHEQSSNVISGKCLYTVGEETREMVTGDSVMVGADIPHELTALEETKLLDVFAPMREDFIS